MHEIDSFKLNTNGLLNKHGENSIYLYEKEIIKFGVRSVQQGILQLSGGFLSLYPGRGYGKSSVAFLFFRLPKVHTICLESHDNILPFWKKCGGTVVGRTYDQYNEVEISRK